MRELPVLHGTKSARVHWETRKKIFHFLKIASSLNSLSRLRILLRQYSRRKRRASQAPGEENLPWKMSRCRGKFNHHLRDCFQESWQILFTKTTEIRRERVDPNTNFPSENRKDGPGGNEVTPRINYSKWTALVDGAGSIKSRKLSGLNVSRFTVGIFRPFRRFQRIGESVKRRVLRTVPRVRTSVTIHWHNWQRVTVHKLYLKASFVSYPSNESVAGSSTLRNVVARI